MSDFRGGRGSMVRRPGSGGGSNLPPLQNIMVMIDQIVIAKLGKSNPAEDYAEVYLLHSIPEMGVTAEFGPDGAPLTKLKLMMPIPQNNPDSKRRDLLGLTQKKAGGPAMAQGSIVIFEKAWFDKKEGILKAQFSRGGPTAPDADKRLKNAYPNIYMCVLPEPKYKNKAGEYEAAGRQEAMCADQEGSRIVTGEDDLRAQIEDIIAQSDIGTAGFQLHIRKMADESWTPEQKLEFAKDPNTRIAGFAVAKPKKVDDQWVPVSTDEILAKLWDQKPAGPHLKELWGQLCAGDTSLQAVFMPMMVVKQANTLVPSSPLNDKGKDNSRIFAIYDADKKGTIEVADYGWTQGHAVIERMAEDSKVYYATYEGTISTRPKMFALPDLPDPFMPDYHLAAVDAEAERLGQNKKAWFDLHKVPAPDAPAEGEPAPGPGR